MHANNYHISWVLQTGGEVSLGPVEEEDRLYSRMVNNGVATKVSVSKKRRDLEWQKNGFTCHFSPESRCHEDEV